MKRFRCPECGAETRLKVRYGVDIVSVYCLKHTAGVDAHLRPVYMTAVTEPLTQVAEQEWTAVAA